MQTVEEGQGLVEELGADLWRVSFRSCPSVKDKDGGQRRDSTEGIIPAGPMAHIAIGTLPGQHRMADPTTGSGRDGRGEGDWAVGKEGSTAQERTKTYRACQLALEAGRRARRRRLHPGDRAGDVEQACDQDMRVRRRGAGRHAAPMLAAAIGTYMAAPKRRPSCQGARQRAAVSWLRTACRAGRFSRSPQRRAPIGFP